MSAVSRRHFFHQGLIASGAVAALSLSTRQVSAATDDLQRAALAGVDYFKRRNADQRRLVQAMRDAIAAGDLAAARQAYIDARPPYEEIETLALVFESTDADIDARPYAIPGGETSDEFRGFHRVEAFLFRDNDLEAALTYTDRLLCSVDELEVELNDDARFSPQADFEGMIGLAEEIGSKKISSEEETWSDQSMLIFKSNAIGIYSQYEPYSRLVAARDEARDTNVKTAYRSMRAVLEPFDDGPGAAMTPYSQVRIAERRLISNATYELRSALISAGETLRVV